MSSITKPEELTFALEKAHNECLMALNGSLNLVSETLFHYTSLNGCLSILESGILRMTDVRYCNDPNEIDEGLEILNNIHEEVISQYSSVPHFVYAMSYIIHSLNLALSFEIHDEKLREKALIDLKKFGINPAALQFKKSSVFVASFSERGDDLRQWLPYADDGRGAAIGFKGLNNDAHEIAEEVIAIKVCYKSIAEKEQYVRDLYKKIFEVYKIMDLVLIGDFVNLVYGGIMFDVIACKSENYKDEQEWRVVSVKDKSLTDDLNFRIRDNVIRPYINAPLLKESILEVKLGPKVQHILNPHSLISVLKKCGYKAKIEKSEIKYCG